tara:strand:- start:5323 stop:5664 length:342 start_codon:yes stop_codon:yes gene_type:complete
MAMSGIMSADYYTVVDRVDYDAKNFINSSSRPKTSDYLTDFDADNNRSGTVDLTVWADSDKESLIANLQVPFSMAEDFNLDNSKFDSKDENLLKSAYDYVTSKLASIYTIKEV